MKIDADPAIKNTQAKSTRSRWIVILASLAALGVFAVAMIVLGMAIFRGMQPADNPALGKVVMSSIPGRLGRAADHHLTAFQSGESLPRLYLDIKFKHLEKLRAKRLEAIDTGSLIARDGDFVPATIRYEERDIPTKIRLKGDALDHLFSDKWSFRVHTRKSDQLFGMRRFSIQSAAVRDHQAEPIFLAHLRREGVLTPRYKFVEVSVNGRDIGVMVIEEHFSKELLESQQRREGVILRFDEGDFWQNFNLNGAFGPYGNPRVALFRPFGGGKVAASPNLSGDRDAATGLMRGFMQGTLSVSEVFDVELMSRFVAVCEVWEAFHPIAWHNMRFYFNPLTARLEPIGFDGNLQGTRIGSALVAEEKGDFVPLLLKDDVFRDAFIRNLNRIANEMAHGETLEWAKGIEAEVLPKIQEGVEDIPPIRWNRIATRAKHLSQISAENYAHFKSPLGNPEMNYPAPLTARLCQNCRDTEVEFVNVLTVPVEVLGVEVKRRKDLSPEAAASLSKISADPVAQGPFPAIVAPTPYLGAPTPLRLGFDSPLDPAFYEVRARVRVTEQEAEHEIDAARYPEVRTQSPLPSATLAEALERHPFLKADVEAGTIRIPPGRWDVEGTMILPHGMALEIGPGTELRFASGQYLLAAGPLRFRGTAEKPIRFAPQDGSENWAGMAVIHTDAPHEWEHVIVESTAGIPSTGWRLTGGVTMRRADVRIKHSVFRGNRAEDALNLIRSQIDLVDVEFHDTSSDALDADFSKGTIVGGHYSQIGGDGIDVSGADIDVDGVLLTDIADKAISVGEGSDVRAKNVRAERVAYGGASKDRSKFLFQDSVVKDASIAGVSCYVKKPEYGPAEATLERVELINVARDSLIQAGSRATIDGVVQETVELDAKAELY